MFTIGDGKSIPNRGQVHLNLETLGAGPAKAINSVFQVTKVTRPLMSVGRICDADNDVLFKKLYAAVLDPNGKEICRFVRKPGGLYVATLRLKKPGSRQKLESGFTRQQ